MLRLPASVQVEQRQLGAAGRQVLVRQRGSQLERAAGSELQRLRVVVAAAQADQGAQEGRLLPLEQQEQGDQRLQGQSSQQRAVLENADRLVELAAQLGEDARTCELRWSFGMVQTLEGKGKCSYVASVRLPKNSAPPAMACVHANPLSFK